MRIVATARFIDTDVQGQEEQNLSDAVMSRHPQPMYTTPSKEPRTPSTKNVTPPSPIAQTQRFGILTPPKEDIQSQIGEVIQINPERHTAPPERLPQSSLMFRPTTQTYPGILLSDRIPGLRQATGSPTTDFLSRLQIVEDKPSEIIASSQLMRDQMMFRGIQPRVLEG